ncbi:unnamed protein product [Brachionus calyciflorus]|uniref:Uncharacterized protein n=1 Tax=Brachionus calyciflorus TaxID=104777 RepID=A0A814HK59_9BILA|nr:unnamed protein product [Brachionus calyciflorus]
MQASIEAIYRSLDGNQTSLNQTIERVRDLRANFINIQENCENFKNDYSALQNTNRTNMDNHRNNINPIIEEIERISRQINNRQQDIKNTETNLKKIKECSKNCDAEFIRRVMNEIENTLAANQVNQANFNNEFTRLNNAINTFNNNDDRIILEFSNVLNELNKLTNLNVTAAPFESLDDKRTQLERYVRALGDQRSGLERLRTDLSNETSQRFNETSHNEKIKLFDSISQLVLKEKENSIKQITQLKTKNNKINSHLETLYNSKNKINTIVEEARKKLKQISREQNNNEFYIWILLILIVFIAFCFK